MSATTPDQDDAFMKDMDSLMSLMENTLIGVDVDSFTLGNDDLLAPLEEGDMLPLGDDEMKALANTLAWESEDEEGEGEGEGEEGNEIQQIAILSKLVKQGAGARSTNSKGNIDARLNTKDVKDVVPAADGPLRFAVGDRVECKGPDEEWFTGTVDELHYRELFWPENQSVAYQIIREEDGEVMYAPSDDESIIRRSTKMGVAEAAEAVEAAEAAASDEDGETRRSSDTLLQEILMVAAATKEQHGHSRGGVPSSQGRVTSSGGDGGGDGGLFTREEVADLLGGRSSVSSGHASRHASGHGQPHEAGAAACQVCVPCQGHQGHGAASVLAPRMVYQNEDDGLINLNQLNAMMEKVHDVMAAGGEVDQMEPAYRDPKTGSVFVTVKGADGSKSVVEIKLTDQPSQEFVKASELADRQRQEENDDDDLPLDGDGECVVS